MSTVATKRPRSSLVPAVFTRRAQAEAAVEGLRRIGFSDEDLGVAVPGAELPMPEDLVDVEEAKGLGKGILLGAPLGSLAGIALGALVLGRLGLGGILIGAAQGALWGLILGGYTGLLARIHRKEDEPHWTDIPLSHEDILVVVRAGDRVRDVHDVVERHGGRCFCFLEHLQHAARS